ncbi:MAG TPA: hypothetical protein VG844_04735 [Terracidiphilus sp.]|nr:hypothetical protein [Terracidiphilus sp.]
MGILVVLIFYAIAFCIIATIGALVMGGIAHFITRRSTSGHKRAIVVSAFFPFACVAFAGVWFVGYAIINYTVFQRDPALGDTWQTPLPSGYELMMIDVTDEGTVYNPKTQPVSDGVVGQADTEFGVRKLQVSSSHIFGVRDSKYFDHIGQDSTNVDTYFDLDTTNGSITEFKSIGELRQHAANEGVQINLRSFYDVYSEYRLTWFDYFALAVLFLIPVTGFLFLVRWVWRIRKQGLPDTFESS